MWRLGLISCSATMLVFAVPAFGDSCLFSDAPPFQLSSDAVEWTMQIASGATCTRGLKLRSANVKNVKLIGPPQSGKVDIKGPSFSYTAKPDFRGQDQFTVQVSGTMVRIAGVSDIKVKVLVVDQ
jgi:Bacterial Ig domain